MKNRFLINVAIFTVMSSSIFASVLKLTPKEKDLSVRNVSAKHGVVASAHPLASKVGIEILKKGGNAIDAAVGVAFTLGLVEPNASGPGGGGYMLINKNNKQKMYSYYQKSPKALTMNKWKEIKKAETYKIDGTGALVPGAVAGWLTALDQQGTMSIKEILEPIIELAEKGFEITPHMATVMGDSFELLSSNSEIEKTFLNDGLPYSEGEIFKNQNYANTLKLISKNGRDGFYKGKIAEALKEINPLISQKDLDEYKPLILEPISTEYRGHKIVTTAPESSGVIVLEMLNMMENYDVKKMGVNSPELYHLWAETMNLSQEDRYHYIGDPTFGTLATEVLASQKYADIRVEEINKRKASKKVQPGYIKKNINQNKVEYECPSTTHVSVIDKNGNAVSMTNTVGLYFGYGQVPKGTGFVLNSHFTNFSSEKYYPVNKLEPGKRPRTTMGPTMVFDKNGKLELVLGSPGAARILSTIAMVVSNVIDHDMDIQEAINQSRIHKMKGKLFVEGHMKPEVIKYLKKLNHKMEVKNANDSYFGGVHAIEVTKNGFEGGADPRRDGKALGY